MRAIALCGVMLSCGHGGGRLQGLVAQERWEEALRRSDECLRESPRRLDCLVGGSAGTGLAQMARGGG